MLLPCCDVCTSNKQTNRQNILKCKIISHINGNIASQFGKEKENGQFPVFIKELKLCELFHTQLGRPLHPRGWLWGRSHHTCPCRGRTDPLDVCEKVLAAGTQLICQLSCRYASARGDSAWSLFACEIDLRMNKIMSVFAVPKIPGVKDFLDQNRKFSCEYRP